MRQAKQKIIWIALPAIIVTIIALVLIRNTYPDQAREEHNPATRSASAQPQDASSSPAAASPPPAPAPLPPSLLLPVPFTPQAPTANWDKLHNEACEEASAIMAAAYYASSTATTLAPKFVESEIAKLTKWQDRELGYHLDSDAAETAQMIEGVYHLNTKLVKDFTEEGLKRELAENRLVIIPENGRLLKNPNYKPPGPIYHMLVVKGYDAEGFVTNDPGTRRGMDYAYAFETLYGAAADWDHSTGTVDENNKVMIVVWK